MGMVKNMLVESPSFEEGLYGLPIQIWIGSDEYAKHKNPRIKIFGHDVPVQITPTGIKLEMTKKQAEKHKLDSKDFKKLAVWMIVNRDIISSYHYVVTHQAKPVKELNSTLEDALKKRYDDVQVNGIDSYMIPFYTDNNAPLLYTAIYDNSLVVDTRQYANYLPNLEKEMNKEKLKESYKETMNEILFLSGCSIIK